MIGFLQGVPQLTQQRLIINVQGVGYEVVVGTRALATLVGQAEVSLFIYTHVREEEIRLFGFLELAERELFELLLSVSGVGPRIGVEIVDKGLSQVTQAIQQADVSFFTSVPRVGKKVAQKIIIELRGKLGGLAELDLGSLPAVSQSVVDGLVALGFDADQADQVVRQLPQPPDNVSAGIKAALKQLTLPV